MVTRLALPALIVGFCNSQLEMNESRWRVLPGASTQTWNALEMASSMQMNPGLDITRPGPLAHKKGSVNASTVTWGSLTSNMMILYDI